MKKHNLSNKAKLFLGEMCVTYGITVPELNKNIVRDMIQDGLRMYDIFPEDNDLEVLQEIKNYYFY